MVGSNRLSERGGWHGDGLAELLEELAEQDLLEVTGYDRDDLDHLLREVVDDDLPDDLEPERQGNDGTVPEGHLLTVDGQSIKLTDDEVAYWRRAYRAYYDRTGTDYGFLLSVLEGDAQHLRDGDV